MNGSSVNVYRCINAKGESVFCKFWWQPLQTNIPTLSDMETLALAGTEPDYYTKDLYDAIAQRNFPKWNFGLQVINIEHTHN